MRVTALLAASALASVVLAGGAGGEARASLDPSGEGGAWGRERHVAVSSGCTLIDALAPRRDYPVAPWAAGLAPIEVVNRNTGARAAVRLYDEHGVLDVEAAQLFMRVAARGAEHGSERGAERGERAERSEDAVSPGDAAPVIRVAHETAEGAAEPLDPRLIQLVARAAYHFGALPRNRYAKPTPGAASRVVVVSATRPGSRGKHGTGEALDFSLDGVRAPILAAYLRTFPRAGVGIYTHPRTQFVHLDVRDRSFHWLDGSPPNVTWRERRLADPKQVARDASWSEATDLPEAASLAP